MTIEIGINKCKLQAIGISAKDYKDPESLNTIRLAFRAQIANVYLYHGIEFQNYTMDEVNDFLRNLIEIADNRLDMTLRFLQQEKERARKKKGKK